MKKQNFNCQPNPTSDYWYTSINVLLAMLDIPVNPEREQNLPLKGRFYSISLFQVEIKTSATELQGACTHACLSIN